jgi:hypothetical protein
LLAGPPDRKFPANASKTSLADVKLTPLFIVGRSPEKFSLLLTLDARIMHFPCAANIGLPLFIAAGRTPESTLVTLGRYCFYHGLPRETAARL